MPAPPNNMVKEVRFSGKGLEAVSPEEKGKVSGGFGDTKKVLILVGLGVVALGVVVYQFTSGDGPAPAEAKTTEPAKAVPATSETAAEPVPTTSKPEGNDSDDDTLSVDRVEDLVREFDTYVQQRQVPLTGLRVNPFEVAQVARARAAEENAQDESDAEAEAEARRRRVLRAAANLKLGSVLIAGDERTAVIQGRLYHVGDIIEGMRVASIAPGHVMLTYEGETVTLRLHPEDTIP